MAKGFEEFEPIFGKIDAEWDKPISNLPSLLPFVFRLDAVDAKRLRLHVTDFHSYTWEAIQSVHQLEDMRDDIGVGGSWSEFVDYVIASVKSDNVKLVLMASKKSTADHGATFAKLIAHKSKGMPLITISLDRLMNSSAADAIANLSLDLFKAFKDKQDLVVKEQERSFQLTKSLSAEQEKNESIQSQLDMVLFSKKHKLRKINTSDNEVPLAIPLGNIGKGVSNSHESPPKPPTEDPVTSKVSHRVVPAYRRAKVRGVFLDGLPDEEGK